MHYFGILMKSNNYPKVFIIFSCLYDVYFKKKRSSSYLDQLLRAPSLRVSERNPDLEILHELFIAFAYCMLRLLF